MADEILELNVAKLSEAVALYLQVTSRTVQQVVNTKAYYIARKAIWFTEKADSYKMKLSLGGLVPVRYIAKSGKVQRRSKLQLVSGSEHSAPLAALIINKRQGRRGEKGLYGRDMARAVRSMLSARARSIGFIKSGWLPSVNNLAPLADRRGAPEIDRTAKQVGRAKGDCRPAAAGFDVTAEIVNLASARRDLNGALLRVGGEGLRIAVADETADTADYIHRKLTEATQGILDGKD
jgi:hypothetical protein